MDSISVMERRNRLAFRHMLAPGSRADDVSEIADGLVALHASDPATVFLSAGVRMKSPSIRRTEDALYRDRSVLRHHAMRRTLWVMTRGVARIAHSATTVRLVAPQERRYARLLEANGVASDGAAWMEAGKRVVADAVREAGTVTAREIGNRFPELAVSLHYGKASIRAHTRILLLLGMDGVIVRAAPGGGWTSSQYVWSTMDDWIPGGFEVLEPQEAAAQLVNRYLDAFGPATSVDVQWWTGLTKTATVQVLADAGAHEVLLDGASGWVSSQEAGGRSTPDPWVAFLPGLDPTTMGWKERDWYLDPSYTASLFDRNGNAGPTIWMDGRIVGGWVQQPSGDIAYRILDSSARSQIDEIDAAAHATEDLFGDARHKVRFPAPLQRELLGS